jgi:hypothetical protein
MDAGIELASQLIENGGDIDCVNWGGVMSSGVNGAASGAIGGAFGKAVTAAKKFRKAAGRARVSGDALKAARAEFNKVKPEFWKDQAARNPGAWSADDLARMRQGKAPIGPDGYPMELHHRTPLAEGGTNSFDNLTPMTRTEHRLGSNYKTNHPTLP